MKPSSPRPTMFRPIFGAALLMAAILCLCPGCDNKQGVVIGEKPPSSPGSDLRGEPVDIGRFKGKVVVLYFWANTCCSDRVKLLEPFYRRVRDKGLAILAVNVGSPAKLVESFAKDNGLTFTLLTDEHTTTSEQYGVFGFPTVFILDGNGIVRQKVLGEISAEQLQKLVERQFDMQKEVQAQFEKSRPR
ncbi:peroxiredoxin [Geobacter sp. AOG2]|uniref:peroxiredoxin family protein n=1 Tax=Geobacter sp. AOG2 TaxID=1566347 RepID=UPI001CC3A893|nr:TlpA disulfide reductase family protein [Geobacter sp. AOG2]GFE62827.1 hypothetical protein AOG2_34160 [Geobacter sp. AOG2]